MTDTIQSNIDTLVYLIERKNILNDSINEQILANQSKIASQLNEIAQNDNSILFLFLGAFLGLVLSLSWNYLMAIKKNRNYRKKLKRHEGLYLAFNKYDSVDSKPFRCFELKLEKNKFLIINGISLLGYEDFKGEINMLEYNLNFGNGYFQHEKAPDNFIGFGFLEIQLTENEILVHETIYNKEGEQNSDPYRWIKQDNRKKNEILKNHREIQKEMYRIKYNAYLKKD